MDIFDLSPEEIATLALAISIAISKQYTNDVQLGLLATFFKTIGNNLALMQLQRVDLEALIQKVQNAQKSKSNETDT
jgi:endonuclease III